MCSVLGRIPNTNKQENKLDFGFIKIFYCVVNSTQATAPDLVLFPKTPIPSQYFK